MVEDVTNSPMPALLSRDLDAHKGTYGRVLVLAGSRGMSGAARLTGKAALRSGAGLVTVACPQEVCPVVAAYEPSYMTQPLPNDEAGRFSRDAISRLPLARQNVVGVGPGLGQSAAIATLVAHVIDQCRVPLVIDADALNVLFRRIGLLRERQDPTIITPHVKEFSRLTDLQVSDILEDREKHAVEFARNFNTIVVLKGHHTVITDGNRVARNQTGNPGMATGGTGDVLTGVICAMLAQGLEAFDAARLGCHLHGMAGDIVADRLGQVGLIASDLLEAIPLAIKSNQR